jgi:hypothetical protein
LAPLHVATHCHSETEKLHRNPAKNEQGAHAGLGKQDESGDDKEESGRHHQQSRVFHVPSLSDIGEMERIGPAKCPDCPRRWAEDLNYGCPKQGMNCRWKRAADVFHEF